MHKKPKNSKSARSTQLSMLPEDDQYRLVVWRSYNGFDADIHRGKEKISMLTSSNIASDISAFLEHYGSFDDQPDYFNDFIRITKGKYPIVYRDEKKKERPLSYRHDILAKTVAMLDITGSKIKLIPAIDIYGDRTDDHNLLTGFSFMADLEKHEVYRFQQEPAWDILDSIQDSVDRNTPDDDKDRFKRLLKKSMAEYFDLEEQRPSTVYTTPYIFNKSGIRLLDRKVFDSGLVVLTQKSIPVMPVCKSCSYRFYIPDGLSGDTVTVIPAVSYGTLEYGFANTCLWFLDPDMRYDLHPGLRTKKRFAIMIETLVQLVDAETKADSNSIIRTALARSEFTKREQRNAAKEVLGQFSFLLNCRPLLLHATPECWCLTEEDISMHIKLISLICRLFGSDPFITHSNRGAFKVTKELFMRQLGTLAQELDAAGVKLEIAEKSIETGKWEFRIDATVSSLDWFELKPDIRCDGELLTNEEIQLLAEGGRILQRNGRLLILDEAAEKLFGIFGSVLNTGKKKKGQSEPVRVPRLQILDWLQLRKYGVEVKLEHQDAVILESLLNFEQIPKPDLPAGIAANLRHYQIDAWHWLAFLYRHRFGACLADDMGLGKTLQGITLLAGIISKEIASAAPAGSPHLVVAPPSLLFNWESEIDRFLPGTKIMLYSGAGRSTADFQNHDIIITSYGVIQRDIEKLANISFDVIIFDETQVVKNLQAATTNAVRKLKGAFTLALTGTPVENHIGEYYAIMDLCLPGLLGSREEFKRLTDKNLETGIKRMVERTRPFVMRRTKQMIATELPPKIEIDIHLELSPKQKALYQATIIEVKEQIKTAFESNSQGKARIIALTAILRLRQICLAPVLALSGASNVSPKLDFLTEQLAELRDEGHSALVFSQFTGYLDIIETGLQQAGITTLRLDGSTPVTQRKKLVQTFQNQTEPMVFLISLKAGGKGLNLTRATYVYHMDPWWNPAVEDQASDRAHRIGQTEQVTITRLLMRHTIEEKMMELKARKLELYRNLLEGGAAESGSGLTREDFEFLLA